MDSNLLPCYSERFKIESRIYRGMMRYKGDAEKIAEFLRIQDLKYIHEVMETWKKRMDKDVQLKTAESIAADYLWEFDVQSYFRDQLISYMMDCIQGNRPAVFSTCCKANFSTVPATGGSPALIICAKCKGSCDTETLLVRELIPLMTALLRDSVLASEKKLDGLERVGLGGLSKAPTFQLNDRRQFLSWNSGGKNKIEEIADMDPYDREAVRLQLERDLQGVKLEGEQVKEVPKEDDGHNTPSNGGAAQDSKSPEGTAGKEAIP